MSATPLEQQTPLEEQTLWGLIEARAAASPDAVMAVDEHDRTITFAEYRDFSARCAAGLAALGIGADSVVAWQLPTWLEASVLVGALSRLGAIQNPMLPIYREREVGFIARQANATLFVHPGEWRGFDFGGLGQQVSDDIVAGGGSALAMLKVSCTPDGDIMEGLPDGDPASLPAAPVEQSNADQPVRWLFYTSGTTADPKGAQHTDGNIAAVALGMSDRLEITDADRNSMVFPFTHIGGITWLFTSLRTGCGNIYTEAFHPVDTTLTLSKNGVTIAGAGTFFHQAYLAYQQQNPEPRIFSNVRLFAGGGAPKPPSLVEDMFSEFGAPVLSGYGLTESPILTMAAMSDTLPELAASEGKPMPGVDIRLVTLAGAIAAQGEEGEIRAKAPQVMRGYLDSSLDADAFDEDGYFRTGDLGRLDADGNVIITGRLKDIIIRKGENVSAKEVEDHLYTHPKVADVAVIGLPDAASGERVCAVIVTAGDEPIDKVEMKDFLVAEGLMIQKVPEQIEFVDALPRNPSGKVLKHELRATYAASDA